MQNALQSFTKLIHIYVNDSNKLIQTKELIDKYDSEFSSFDKNHELQGAKRKFYFYKGRYFEGVNQLDSAEYYYRKIYRPNMSYTAMDPMYRGLLSVFTKRHQSDSIAKYSQLLCLANDCSSHTDYINKYSYWGCHSCPFPIYNMEKPFEETGKIEDRVR